MSFDVVLAGYCSIWFVDTCWS